ncbi:MAG: ParB/RepB/Spo0J family partition protein [Chloroflexi bacterium]|nr:ParB/RepB/Spo0J family partition protein [Chloroflexota bacterium]MBK7179096.1 ParB/RepB/Spo0J family partition protein [Chloroflexota bacterium]MBK7917418.1 ParB/RepB/Spo0J family partition protein [Chloroflexota bacterium]MBK8933206.1 ParB/RepB/Spo0J family partition protein [Chloroflexota bacterium]MBP6804276.1 ParB/RepB/Spo0J family partition protein [Chloroflexota bacterium]
MTKKHGLGRGLGALIPTADTAVSNDDIRLIPVADIYPNPHQPRTAFNDEQLAELAASITEHGLIQPLVVTQQDGKFILIAGERRWRASQLAGLEKLPAIIKEATPQAMLELAIIENIQRADLNALEEAFAYQQLMEGFGLTQEEVAKRVGKGRSTVANLLRLLTLPPNIQQAVSDGQISGAHGRALLPLPTPEMQTNAMKQIMKLDLSVRQTEQHVKNLLAEEKPAPKPKKKLPPELADLQTQFEHSLGTRVTINKKRKGGQVVIHYYSDEELQSIYETIVGEEE